MGTPNYMAPEIMVQAEEGYNQSAGELPHRIFTMSRPSIKTCHQSKRTMRAPQVNMRLMCNRGSRYVFLGYLLQGPREADSA